MGLADRWESSSDPLTNLPLLSSNSSASHPEDVTRIHQVMEHSEWNVLDQNLPPKVDNDIEICLRRSHDGYYSLYVPGTSSRRIQSGGNRVGYSKWYINN